MCMPNDPPAGAAARMASSSSALQLVQKLLWKLRWKLLLGLPYLSRSPEPGMSSRHQKHLNPTHPPYKAGL